MQHNSINQCRSFDSNGTTSGTTHNKTVAPLSKPVTNKLFIKSKDNEEVWISTAEGATLLETSIRQVQRLIKSNRFTVKLITGNGGKQHQILLTSLPKKAQVKYWSERIPIPAKVTDEMEIEIALNRYQSEPEYNRKKADKYLPLLKMCNGKKGKEIEKIISVWNTENPDIATSYRSVKRMQKEYEQNGMDALVAKYGKTKNQFRSIEALGQIGSKAYEMFCSLYLGEGAPSVHSCWMATYGYAQKLWAETHGGDVTEFDDLFPVGETFLRAAERKHGESAIYLARYGQHAHNQKYANFINRDYSGVIAGEVWVSDHRQLDQMWLMPDGSFKRPWFTAWICFKTQKVLSWSLHVDAPRADHVIDTFVDGVEQWGIPYAIYIDNGKDYRCNDFAGGRKIKVKVDERKTRSLLATLGVEVHFAAPYNAQAKIIERVFLIFKEWLDKHSRGYTGGNHVERPEILESRLKRRDVTKYDDGVEAVKFFIENVLHTQKSKGKVLAGRSRDEAFFSEYKGRPKVSGESLALLRARNSEVRTIGANGIKERLLNDFYWAEWMEERKGLKVYLRRSMNSQQNAYVFDAVTDEYLGAAQLGMWNAAALAKTDLDKQQLQTVLTRKKQTQKAINLLAKVQAAPDYLQQLQYAAMNGVETEQTANTSDITKITRYDDTARIQERLAATGTDGNSVLFGGYEEPEIQQVYSMWQD